MMIKKKGQDMGFTSQGGQVEDSAYKQSQIELQQRQMAEQTVQAEQKMLEAVRLAQQQRDNQTQREQLQREQIPRDAQLAREQQQRDDQLQRDQSQRDQQQGDDHQRASSEQASRDKASSEQATRDRYVQELFALTAAAATPHSQHSHSALSGASAGNIHSDATLMPRNWAAEQNAQQGQNQIPSYHEAAPVITYNTDLQTTDVMRTHYEKNEIGRWATRSTDINNGHISGEEAQRRLSLSHAPTHVSDVNVPKGSFVESSRPISGEARQYNLVGHLKSWFTNSRPLG